MDILIEQLPFTDESTKVTLQDLVDKKNKVKQTLNKLHVCYSLFYCSACALLINSHLLWKAVMPRPFQEQIQILLNENLNKVIIIILIITGCGVIVFQKKHNKLDNEFEQLRFEIIEQAPSFWQDEAWLNRHLIFNSMKKNFNINLFSKN